MDALQQKAIKVIKPLIPPDAGDRVMRTVKQLNTIVRDRIRAKTGLRLSVNQTRSAKLNETQPVHDEIPSHRI